MTSIIRRTRNWLCKTPRRCYLILFNPQSKTYQNKQTSIVSAIEMLSTYLKQPCKVTSKGLTSVSFPSNPDSLRKDCNFMTKNLFLSSATVRPATVEEKLEVTSESQINAKWFHSFLNDLTINLICVGLLGNISDRITAFIKVVRNDMHSFLIRKIIISV